MASPTPSDFVVTTVANGTSNVVNIPTSAVAGDRVFIAFSYAVTGNTISLNGAPTGLIVEKQVENTTGGTNGLYCLVYEVQGAETTVTLNSSASTKGAAVACRIQGDSSSTAPEFSTGTTTANGPPDPDVVTPTGGSKDYLFIIAGGMGGETALTGADADYSNFTEADSGAGGAVTTNSRCAIATRQLTAAASDDPTAFTGGDATQESAAMTVAFHPAAAGTPATVTPATITRSFTIDQAGAQGQASVTPATIARSFTTPATGPQAASSVTPATVGRAFAVDQVSAGVSVTVTPTTIARAFNLGAAVFDTFNRADSGTLGTSDSGHEWTSNVGTWEIVGNQASQTSATASAQASLDLGTPDQVVEADLVHATAQQYVMARYTAGSSYYIAGFQASSNTLTLFKQSGGFTSLGTYAHSAHTGTVRLSVQGSGNIEVWLDGVSRITSGDTAITTGNRAGLFGNGALIDNFSQVGGGGATAHGEASITPATVGRAFVVPQATPTTDTVVSPVTIARAFVMPQTTPQAASAVTPATIARAFLVPQASPQAASSITPATIARAFVLPQAAPKGAVLVTPGTVATLVTIPQVVAGAETFVTPATIARAVGIPQAQVQAAVSVTPATFAALVGIPQATATGAAAATVTPATIAAAFGIPQAQTVTIAALVITREGPLAGGAAAGGVLSITGSGPKAGGAAAGSILVITHEGASVMMAVDEAGRFYSADGVSETGLVGIGGISEAGHWIGG